MNLAISEPVEVEPLCCCEYYDHKNERNHILACCCNCEVFDEFVTRLLCCRSIDKKLKKEMWLTIKDRVRCPYPGGARQFVFFETLIPLILIVICQLIAAVNVYCTVVIFVGTIFLLFYTRRRHSEAGTRTNFYSLWFAWSTFYMLALFQLNVPMLEILPEENFVYVILLTMTCICYYKTRHRAPRHFGHYHADDDDDHDDVAAAQLLAEEGKYMGDVDDDIEEASGEYEFWINTVVSRHNHRYYITGCCFGMLTFFLYADLVLTAVCHPIIIARIANYDVMVPDQCVGVYDQSDLALGFTGGVHALFIAFFILGKLLQEVFFITRGISSKHGERVSRKTCLSNWKSFLCN